MWIFQIFLFKKIFFNSADLKPVFGAWHPERHLDRVAVQEVAAEHERVHGRVDGVDVACGCNFLNFLYFLLIIYLILILFKLNYFKYFFQLINFYFFILNTFLNTIFNNIIPDGMMKVSPARSSIRSHLSTMLKRGKWQ
jgi:hypothetical protein